MPLNLSPTNRRAPWPLALAALCSLGAATIHFAVAPEHFEEWWGYGLFFFLLGAFQALYAIGLLGPELRTAGARWYLAIGVLANLLVIGVYVISRTLGIPFFGPQAGEVEAVGTPDVVSKVLELTLVAILARYLYRRWAQRANVQRSP